MLRELTIAATAAAGLAWVRRGGIRHVVVAGPSMLPTLAPGDRLLLVRAPGPARVGQLATTHDPRAPSRVLLKRIHAVDHDGVQLRGDNSAASTDSRAFGMVRRGSVRRWVAWRYAPAGRVGRIR